MSFLSDGFLLNLIFKIQDGGYNMVNTNIEIQLFTFINIIIL